MEPPYSRGGVMKRELTLSLLAVLILASTTLAQKKERTQPADVYIRTARIALKEKDFKRAETNLAICLENYPDNYDAHFLMGVIWAEKDQIDSMVTEFNLARLYAGNKLKKIQSDMEDIEQSKWEYGFNNGVQWINTADSLELAANQMADTTEEVRIRKMRMTALEESARNFRNCTLIKPNEFRGWFNLGLVYDRKRDWSQAAQLYRRAEELFHTITLQDSTTNYYDTTLFFTGQGEPTPLFEEILKKYKKLKQDVRTRYKGLLTALGAVYFELGEYENTVIVFRRLLGFYEEDLSALEYIASSYQQLDMPDEALKYTRWIIKRNPDDKDRLYNVAVHYYNDGVEAKREYEELLRMKLEGKQVPDIDSKIAKSEDRYQRSYGQALDLLDRVLELDVKDKESWKLKGGTLFFLGRYEDAIPVLDKVRTMFPDDKTVCQMLRECYRQLDDVDKVLELTEECGL
jgi:tetratricopeptide (TPR) repeat protein